MEATIAGKGFNIPFFAFDKSNSQEINVRNSLMNVRQTITSNQTLAFPFKYHIFL